MIKRPLIGLFGAYLGGLLLAWYRFPTNFMIATLLIGIMVLYLLMFRIKQGFVNRRDSFLWSLPFLLLLGFMVMGQSLSPPKADDAFTEKADCTLTGEITMIADRSSGRTIYTANNLITFTGGMTYPVDHIIILTSDHNKYLVGNKLQVSGRIYQFSEPTNPGQFNERMYYKIQNIDYKVIAKDITINDSGYSRLHHFLGNLRQKLQSIYTGILPQKEAGVMTAMLLGEKYLLEDELRQLYQDNGIAHILAISGLHITLIGYSLYQLLRKCKAGLYLSTILSILFIYCYGIFTNFSVSTNRAVVMFIVMLLSKIIGKTYDTLSAIALSAFLILLGSPLQLFSAGFQLSFGAVLGISVLLPCLQKLLPFKSKLSYTILASISAQLLTLPLILYFFYQLPVYSVIINLLVLPSMTALMLSAIAAGMAGLLSIPLGVFLIGGANYISKFIEGICRLGSNLPGNLYTTGKPGAIRMILYALLLVGFIWAAGRYKLKRLILLPLFAVIILLIPVRNSGLSVTMLDVGQGEAIFLENEIGTTYLIDGGSSDVGKVGTYRIQPYLLSSGVDQIDYAIVTHADEDHVNGLKELMQSNRIRIRHLVLPGVEIRSRDSEMSSIDSSLGDKSKSNNEVVISKNRRAAEEAYLELELLAMKSDIKVLYINDGDSFMDGNLRLECLHPTEDYSFTSSNSYSTVLSISYGEFDMLLTGDLERDGERLVTELLNNMSLASGNGTVTDYDVLKVAHHGSKNSTTDRFLQIVKPEISLISCSKENRYGHPHKELLERLGQAGSKVMITYETGALTIRTDGERMGVSQGVSQGRSY